jgi:CheY-like chemotaxis protein
MAQHSDIIISDVMMPEGESGFEVVEILRSDHPAVIAIILLALKLRN